MKSIPLRHRLFISFLLTVIVSILAVGGLTAWKIKRFYLEQTEQHLHSIVRGAKIQISLDFTPENIAHLDSLTRKIGAATSYRITLIAKSGAVLGDSEYDVNEMENHADRPEIKEALAKGKGVSLRYSPTLEKMMIYAAQSYEYEGKIVGAVRASISLTDIDEALTELFSYILIIGLIIVIAAAVLSYITARSITSPLEAMRDGALRFANGEYAHRLAVPHSPELAKLAQTLNKTAVQLQDRIVTITKQKNELEALLSSMAEGVLAFDTEERLIKLNQAAADLLEIEVDKSSGRMLQEVVRNPRLCGFIQELLSEKENLEREISLKNGLLTLQIQGTLLKDANGKEIGCLVLLHDVTGIRRTERVRRDFVANVSHEFRTPITAVKGFVETLLEGALDDKETAREFLKIVAKHMDRLNELISGLLCLSRIEKETEIGEIAMQTGNIKEVIDSALENFKSQAEQKNIELKTEGPSEVQAEFNRALMEQAVSNLLSNALKYSAPQSTVEVGIAASDRELSISVKDNGIGIEEERLPRIFERFYRIDKNRNRGLGGTGLGLAIVKHIALAHRGRVEVESVYGKGSVFRIIIPVKSLV